MNPRLCSFVVTIQYLLLSHTERLLRSFLNLNEILAFFLVAFCPQVLRAASYTVKMVRTGLDSKVVYTDTHRRYMHCLDLPLQEGVALTFGQCEINVGHRANDFSATNATFHPTQAFLHRRMKIGSRILGIFASHPARLYIDG